MTRATEITGRVIRKDKRFDGWQYIASERIFDTPVSIRVLLMSPCAQKQVSFDMYNHDTLKGYVSTLRKMLDRSYKAIGPTTVII